MCVLKFKKFFIWTAPNPKKNILKISQMFIWTQLHQQKYEAASKHLFE